MKYLIDFKHDASDQEIQSYIAENNCVVLKEWDNFEKSFLVETESALIASPLIDRIVNSDFDLAIQPLDIISVDMYYGTHGSPNKESIIVQVNDDKDWWKNYSYKEPEFDKETLTLSRLGDNIKVYLMDSGIDLGHPEFIDADIQLLYSVTPDDFSDNRGHGTALASVIVGKTCGITNASLKVVKIFDNNHTTTQLQFLDALDAIINDHEDNTFSVLNASWTIPKNEWVEHKLRILEDEGVFILAAAGNNGTSIEDVTPASMLDVITIGAYNKDLKPCNFSNYTGSSIISVTGGEVNHGELDGWAPGEQIWAAGLNGTYGYVAGTSIATAISSAILCLNLTWSTEEDGDRMLHATNLRVSTAYADNKTILFSRKNILEYSDNKYDNSDNVIATISDKKSTLIHQKPDEFTVVSRVGITNASVKLFENMLTKSVEWIIPLPENFVMLKNGQIMCFPVESQGPGTGDPEKYREYQSILKRTNIDDTVETVTVNIFVLGENSQPEDFPEDSPIVISLQASCGPQAVFSCGAGGSGTCFDECPGNSNCCVPISGDKFAECLCT